MFSKSYRFVVLGLTAVVGAVSPVYCEPKPKSGLEGSSWKRDSWVYYFESGGKIRIVTAVPSTATGTWRQSGKEFTLEAQWPGSSSPSYFMKGTINGSRIEGVWWQKGDARRYKVTLTRVAGGKGMPDSQRLSAIAERLQTAKKYQAVGKKTKCSLFVRDFAKEFLDKDLSELDGDVAAQFKTLTKSSRFEHLVVDEDAPGYLKTAQAKANRGKLVLYYWPNPTPTPGDSGHAAVGVPVKAKDTMRRSEAWGMRVPFIAQAGRRLPRLGNESVHSYIPLSDGFGSSTRKNLHIFILK